jgi:hypothetical protein
MLITVAQYLTYLLNIWLKLAYAVLAYAVLALC